MTVLFPVVLTTTYANLKLKFNSLMMSQNFGYSNFLLLAVLLKLKKFIKLDHQDIKIKKKLL